MRPRKTSEREAGHRHYTKTERISFSGEKEAAQNHTLPPVLEETKANGVAASCAATASGGQIRVWQSVGGGSSGGVDTGKEKSGDWKGARWLLFRSVETQRPKRLLCSKSGTKG